MFKKNKGKLLKIKKGYNPNSSSIGSIIFAIPTMLFVASIIFLTSTSFVFARYIKILKNKKNISENQENKD